MARYRLEEEVQSSIRAQQGTTVASDQKVRRRVQDSRDMGLEWGHVADCRFRKQQGVKTERM